MNPHGLRTSESGRTYRYPGQDAPALQDVSLYLGAGRALEIVGPSGAGESSLAYLLLRFWEYDSGEIRLNGNSLQALSPDEVRAQIGFVSPQAYFFDTTVHENLRLARRGVTRPEIEQAQTKPRSTISSAACLWAKTR